MIYPTSLTEILCYFLIISLFLCALVYLWPNGGVPMCNALNLPIVGHLFSVKPDRLHRQLVEWSKLSKDGIFQLNLLGEKIIVVSNYDGIREVLVTKDDEFAGRPHKQLFLIATFGGKDIALSDFSPRLIYRKRMFMKHIKSDTVQEMNVEQITLEILADYSNEYLSSGQEIDLLEFFVNLTVDIILSMILGKRTSINDHKIVKLRQYLSEVSKLSIDTKLQLYEFLPWLKNVYHTKQFKKYISALDGRNKVLNELLKEHATDCASGEEGFYGALLNDPHKCLDNDEIFLIILDTLFAGYGTSSVVLQMFFSLMLKHKDVKKNIMDEIEKVIGFSRPPSCTDKENMPYTSATILEVMRWISHIPILVPHKTTVNTSLMGFPVKKDTTIYVNNASLLQDEKIWGDPQTFRPERFLAEDGSLLKPNEGCRKYLFLFGAGRRICPGKGFANNRMFLIMVYLLQRFNITAVDHEENSKLIYEPDQWKFDFVLGPGKFYTKFTVK